MPFPNEHAARIKSPLGCDEITRDNDRFGQGRDALFCVKRSATPPTSLQSIRFDKDLHSPAEAREWLTENGFTFLLFEKAALPGKRAAADEVSLRKGIDPDLCIRAFHIDAETIDKKTMSVEGILASEHPVLVRDPRTRQPVDEVLLMSGMRLPDQVPLLDSHQRTSIKFILGSVRDFRIEKHRDHGPILIGRNFFDDDEDGQKAFGKVQRGHVRDFSIGYRIHGLGEIMAMRTARIAGREFTAGARNLRVSVDTEVRENSLLAIGADPVAKVRKQGALS